MSGRGAGPSLALLFIKKNKSYLLLSLFIWLHPVLIAALGAFPSLGGFSLQPRDSPVVALGLSSCGLEAQLSHHAVSQFPDQGSNPHPLRCKADS